MFEKASRIRLRFATTKGNLAVEDLWAMGLTDLDEIAKHLDKKLKTDTVSFIRKVDAKDELPKMSFDIVKHIIDTKLAESEAAENAAVKKERKQQILAAMANKESEERNSASMEDLQKMLDEVG